MRWTLPGMVLVCVGLWIDALAGGQLAGGDPALIVVAALAFCAGLRAGVLSLASCGLASIALLATADQVGSPGQFALADDVVFYAVVVLAPAAVGWLLGSRRRQVVRLDRRRAELEQQRAVAGRLAREVERRRVEDHLDLELAGRLRDITAAARGLHEPGDLTGRLEQLESLARDALTGLRDVLGALHQADSPRQPEPTVPGAAPRAVQPIRRGRLIDAVLVLALVPLSIETALSAHHGPVELDVALSLAQGVALAVVRWRVLTGLVALYALAAIQTAWVSPLPPTVSWLMPGLLSAFLIGFVRRRTAPAAALWLAGAALTVVATPAAHRTLAGTVPVLIMAALAGIGGRLVAGATARAEELRAITAELERTGDQRARLDALEQRAELARELHDVGAHSLTVVCLQAAAARTWWTRDELRSREALDAVHAVATGALTQIASTVLDLADGTAPESLTAESLDLLAGIGRAVGMRVELDLQPFTTSDEVARVAYRIVQESLTNAARHAGRTSVQVRIGQVGERFEVRIANAGGSEPALAVPGSGRGLQGMRDRVAAVDGQLTAGPNGHGYEVVALLPVAAPEA